MRPTACCDHQFRSGVNRLSYTLLVADLETSRMKLTALIVIGLAIAPSALAQYRCVVSGKTVFQDRPCVTEGGGSSPKSETVIGDSANVAYSTTNGTWRGQVQFMAKAGTTVVSEAHAVGPIVIDIDPRGKVTGNASEAGCILKGIAKPSVFPTITELDVTLSNCSYPGFNRRMGGRVALYSERRYVDFRLVANDFQRRPVGTYELKGTLRR
jgi:hypothetical protein